MQQMSEWQVYIRSLTYELIKFFPLMTRVKIYNFCYLHLPKYGLLSENVLFMFLMCTTNLRPDIVIYCSFKILPPVVLKHIKDCSKYVTYYTTM